MTFTIGMHSHRHGESLYLFNGEVSESDFITYLGEEFEPDREEFVSVQVTEPETLEAKGGAA